jgi:hypothetical protein
MSQYITETTIKKGAVEIYNIPFPNDTDVKVIIIPKVDIDKLFYSKAIELSKTIKGNMSDDIVNDRN